jgi:undecaprenyl-diphosphatase
VIEAIIWGLVQGLTEFLPVSSSGHLVLVPAFLSQAGMDIAAPELAVSAVLHLGTLVAVLAYYRKDLLNLTRAATDPEARRVLGLLALGTVPAVIGLVVKDALDRLEEDPRAVAVALLFTGLVLAVGSRLPVGDRRLESSTPRHALRVGIAQAMALVPGVSRSGMTITEGLRTGLAPAEAAKFSFLLAIPTIAGGGLLSLLELTNAEVSFGPILVGLTVSAVSGYLAIAALLKALAKVGFAPFSIYCLVMGVAALIVL